MWVESVGYRTDSRHGVHDAEKTGVACGSTTIFILHHSCINGVDNGLVFCLDTVSEVAGCGCAAAEAEDIKQQCVDDKRPFQ